MGPMAEVVFRSTQYLSDGDIAAMAAFLKSLPQTAPRGGAAATVVDKDVQAHGASLYKDHCAACHGADGAGGSGPAGVVYAPLAGNRKVLLEAPANLIHIVVNGGFPPTTAGNPRPYGMPPFGPSLTDAEIAVLATYVRGAWGNTAPAVSALDVLNAR
jgi:mono/diheme cytochrome c family protein